VAAPPQNAADAARQRIADPRSKQRGKWSNIEATETAMWRLRKRVNDPNHWRAGSKEMRLAAKKQQIERLSYHDGSCRRA